MEESGRTAGETDLCLIMLELLF